MNDPNNLSVEQIMSDLMDAWNNHDAARVSTFYSEDYLGEDVSITEQQRGPEGVRRNVQGYLNTFPDLKIQAKEMIANHNRVAVKVQVNGTQRGTILNIPATGCAVEVHGVAFLTLEGGKIKYASYLWDVAGFLRTIGLLPDL